MDDKASRVETGIAGFDKLLGGGLAVRSHTLIAGGPGTGKTLVAFEILYHCALAGKPSAYITLDERSDNLLKNVKETFSSIKDVDELVRKKMMVIGGDDSSMKIAANTEQETSYSMGNLVSELEGIIKLIDAQVVAIDSVSFLKLMLGKTPLYNKSISSLIANMRRMSVTAIFTMDIPYYEQKKMKFGQELLLFDNIIGLYKAEGVSKGDFSAHVVKTRGSDHEQTSSKYSITPEGVVFK